MICEHCGGVLVRVWCPTHERELAIADDLGLMVCENEHVCEGVTS